MKKLLVFVLACLSSTIMFAQPYTNHWTVEDVGSLPFTAYYMISIDDVMQNVAGSNTQYTELGVFDQNGICRCSEFPVWKSKKERWVYILNIQGENGYTYSFKLYDHTIPQELAVTCEEDGTVAFEGYGGIGSTSNPETLHFQTVATVETRTLTIHGYNDSADPKEWNFIASPFDGVDPLQVTNMINTNTPDYDLFYFDQSAELEWRNYKQAHFNLASGTGYLYACKTGVELTFTGTPFNGPSTTVDIVYDNSAPHAYSKGWNLVGNPFTDEPAYFSDNRNFYTLNDAGDGINAEYSNGAIAPMTAVFVESAENGETITFNTTPSGKGSELALNLSKDSKLVDRAIVRFDSNRNMRKFQLFENSTKLYIEQDNKDYAVVAAEAQGEMPLSFKAEKNGSYTLSLNTENVEFGYLHLIDNLTGNEVDLLANPSYSFEATTSDYASRFRLVFATSDAANSQFAFVGNGEIFLTGQGNVQVYDVTGRLVSNHNEVTHISTNGMSAGVYMIQLSNGSDVKTQKIVVK